MNFLLALSVLCGFAAKLTTASGLNVTAIPPTTMNVTSSGCRGQLKVYNNFVESPGYPFRYPNNMDCYFWVPIHHGKALKIVFDHFNLESQSSCSYDYLRIRNETGFTYGKYCGVHSGKIVVVTGSRASFHFHSDSSVQRQGFMLYLSTISSGCSPIVNNTWESPGYPSSYPDNLDCNVSVPIPSGAEMRIVFDVFYLPNSSFDRCWYDYLIIRNENGDDFGTYCGSRRWKTVMVNGSIVVLTFHSDHRNNVGRFRLLFTPVYPTAAPWTQPPAPLYPACPQVVNNTMESPGYPRHYSHRMDCNISVPIPFGANMRVFFQVFFIDRSGWSCRYYGSLEIMNENGTSFGRYCGYRNGQAVVMNGSLVVLKFRSGYYGSYGRFRLLFTPVYPTVAPLTQPPAPTTYPVCPQVVNNTMESPGYPSYYTHRIDCNISVPIPSGKNMRVFFEYFYMPRYDWNCRYYGYLEIMNENGDSFEKYCGNKTGQAVVVNGSLVLRYRSGYYGSYGRFRLLFTTDSPTVAPLTQPPSPTTYPVCPQVVNNTMESPGYPSYYSLNIDCRIFVPIPLGENMRVFFQVFYIYRSVWSCWYYGYLEIMNENGDSFGKFCGNKTGQAVLVNGNLVVLRFRPGLYAIHGQFRLLFTPVYPFPTSHPNSSQIPTSHGRDPQSQLRKFIANLRDILVQMESVVDNQLGGSSSGNFTKRDHIARINDAVKYVETAMKRAGQQKRNLDIVTFEQLKKRTAEVIAKMEDKEDQFKERAQLDAAKGKSQVEDQKLARERERGKRPKNLFKEEKIGR